MSGARGIDRRLRVVEHGCCGRGANLVSVQFVKRSAGKRERSAKILLYDAKRADSAPLTAVFQQVHEEKTPHSTDTVEY